jgi:hypothetical protein
MSDSSRRWFEKLPDILGTAVKTNQELLKKGIDMIKEPMAYQAEFSRIFFEGSSIVSHGFMDLMRINAEHSRRLIALGQSLSNDILASFKNARKTATGPHDEQSFPGRTAGEIRMSGVPGDLCRSVFILESNKSGAVSARIRCSRFVNINDNSPVSVPMLFDPSETVVRPGEKIRFTVETGIAENIPAGMYHAMIWIDGFPELNLRAVLTVHDVTDKTQLFAESRTSIMKPENP